MNYPEGRAELPPGSGLETVTSGKGGAMAAPTPATRPTGITILAVLAAIAAIRMPERAKGVDELQQFPFVTSPKDRR